MKKFIPMTKATGLGPLPAMLEQQVSAKALNRVFEGENVPLGILENREIRMPLVSMIGLFENAARETGSRTFGLSAGEAMSPDNFGLWLIYCATAPTLGVALQRSDITAKFQQSGSRLLVERKNGCSVWRYIVPGRFENSIQHADHLLGPMIKFVRIFLGARWQPEWVELNYPRDSDANLLERELGIPVKFDCAGIGVAIRTELLNRPRLAFRKSASQIDLTLFDVNARESTTRFNEPVQSLFSIVVMRLLEGQSDVEGAARMAGLGVQTLQRRLRREGLTYRNLVDAARLGKARALLIESDLNITEIAFGLGYSDHANFTRAFTRWTSCSPSEFRRLNGISKLG